MEQRERLHGTVKWYQPALGYGFLTDQEGRDYFCHQLQIRMEGFRKLKNGQRVEFSVGEDEGKTYAADVVVTEE